MGPMDVEDRLAGRFEASRPRLRAMAYRMLGSLSDADDAVQEGWLHAARATARGGADDVANLEGWFTTIVGRVCLDMLRSRKSRREDPLDPDRRGWVEQGPEQEAMLADSVGLALLVVLDTLPPAERVAFVLHDTFGLPFGEIASITGRSPAAARQLASRGRRRIQGADPDADAAAGERLARQRRVTEAFIAAARGGDLEGLIAVLDPEVVLHSDATASPSGVPLTVHGAAAVGRRGAGRLGARQVRVDRPGQRGSRPDHGAARTAADRARLHLLRREDQPDRRRRRPGPAGSARPGHTRLTGLD